MIIKYDIEDIILKHFKYLESVDYQGWDVFDGLNSKLFEKSFLSKNFYARLAWIQLIKRSPINLRKITFVPKEFNPKALGLFISGLLNLHAYFNDNKYLKDALILYEKLVEFQSKNYTGLSWGYNFDWQAKAFFVPKFKPNMVCSVFAGHALLDLSRLDKGYKYLQKAEQVAEFILEHLKLVKEVDQLCFGYIPGESAIVHNANLLGAGFLSRLGHFTDSKLNMIEAEKSIRYSVSSQRQDGGWTYGERNHHQWVDNFHTGYNLVSIYQYQRYAGDRQFEEALIRGLDFHLKNHFTKEMLPKYTDQSLYPLDVHCFSQAIFTFYTLREYIPDYRERIEKIIANAIELLWDEKKHYYYFQKHRFYTIRIPYIRWAQAWMFYALTFYLMNEYGKKN